MHQLPCEARHGTGGDAAAQEWASVLRVALCCAAAMRARAGAARLCCEDDFALLLPGFVVTAECGSESTRLS